MDLKRLERLLALTAEPLKLRNDAMKASETNHESDIEKRLAALNASSSSDNKGEHAANERFEQLFGQKPVVNQSTTQAMWTHNETQDEQEQMNVLIEEMKVHAELDAKTDLLQREAHEKLEARLMMLKRQAGPLLPPGSLPEFTVQDAKSDNGDIDNDDNDETTSSESSKSSTTSKDL
jgi:hypothetical protein